MKQDTVKNAAILLKANRTCDEIAYELSHRSAHHISTKHLQRRKITTKYVPHNLLVNIAQLLETTTGY